MVAAPCLAGNDLFAGPDCWRALSRRAAERLRYIAVQHLERTSRLTFRRRPLGRPQRQIAAALGLSGLPPGAAGHRVRARSTRGYLASTAPTRRLTIAKALYAQRGVAIPPSRFLGRALAGRYRQCGAHRRLPGTPPAAAAPRPINAMGFPPRTHARISNLLGPPGRGRADHGLVLVNRRLPCTPNGCRRSTRRTRRLPPFPRSPGGTVQVADHATRRAMLAYHPAGAGFGARPSNSPTGEGRLALDVLLPRSRPAWDQCSGWLANGGAPPAARLQASSQHECSCPLPKLLLQSHVEPRPGARCASACRLAFHQFARTSPGSPGRPGRAVPQEAVVHTRLYLPRGPSPARRPQRATRCEPS